jgi:hypothetical protein
MVMFKSGCIRFSRKVVLSDGTEITNWYKNITVDQQIVIAKTPEDEMVLLMLLPDRAYDIINHHVIETTEMKKKIPWTPKLTDLVVHVTKN